MKFEEHRKNVLEWAENKGIMDFSTPLKQIEKTREEVEETRDALVRIHENSEFPLLGEPRITSLDQDVKDGIGDTIVTLIILAELCGTDIETCLSKAWNEIKDRKGQMIDGTFVKEVVAKSVNPQF